jgi:putative hydrolase of the HAD superfamily
VLHFIYESIRLKDFALYETGEFVDRFLQSNAYYWGLFNHGMINKEGLRLGRFEQALGEVGLQNPHLVTAAAALFTELCPKKSGLLPGAAEVLDNLHKRGYTLHIVTNGFDSSQKIKLESADIARFFSTVTTSESAGYRKPQTEFFDKAIASAACLKREGIVIGDNPDTDIKGALNAGLAAVWYNPNRKNSTVKAHHEIYHLESLLQLLP